MDTQVKPSFTIRNRYLVWVRQLAYLSIVLLLLWKLTQVRILTLDPIYICVLCYSIAYNDVPDDQHNMKWLLLDLSQLLYACILLFEMTELGLTFNIIVFCLSVCGCYCAVANAVFEPSYSVYNEPTAEFTCTLFQSISFSYINNSIIIPGCRLASFELDFLPSLMDCDSAAFVWRRFQSIYEFGREFDPSDDLNSPHAGEDGDFELFVSRQGTRSLGNLIHAIYLLFRRDIWLSLFYNIVGTLIEFVTPLALQRIMFYLSNYNGSTAKEEEAAARSGLLLGGIDVYSAVALMLLCPAISGMHTANTNTLPCLPIFLVVIYCTIL
jgi:hypothetical protein